MPPVALLSVKIFQYSLNAPRIESYLLRCVTLWCLLTSLACCSDLLDLKCTILHLTSTSVYGRTLVFFPGSLIPIHSLDFSSRFKKHFTTGESDFTSYEYCIFPQQPCTYNTYPCLKLHICVTIMSATQTSLHSPWKPSV